MTRAAHGRSGWWVGVAAAVAVAAPGVAHAADAEDACIQDAMAAQKLMRAGKLVEARSHLAACRKTACPTVVRVDCSAWSNDVDAAVGTVVFATVDERGADVPDAVVTVDGKPIPGFVPGRATELDPGNHEVGASAPGHTAATKPITVRETEKGRLVRLELRRAPAATTAPGPSSASATTPASAGSGGGVPTASWMLFGGAVVAGGAGALLGVLASSERDDLATGCGSPTPACTSDDTRGGRTLALGADIAFAVAIVAATAGVVVWLAAPSGAPDTKAARRSALRATASTSRVASPFVTVRGLSLRF